MGNFNKIIVAISAAVILLSGVYFFALWVNNIAHRLAYPFPIEYLEDAIFFHALRVYNGEPIYVDPNSGFAAIIYAPGYFYILGWLFKIFGPSIITARVISLACTVSILTMLAWYSSRRLRFPLSAIPACIYLTLLYSHFAGYQDLGRVDPLMLLMILAGIFLIGDGKSGMKRVIAGVVVITLACYVKQPAMAYLPFVYGFVIWRDRKAGLIAAAVSLALLIGIFIAANASTGGWFGYYTLKLPLTHQLRWDRIRVLAFGGHVHYPVRGIMFLLMATLIYIAFRLLFLRKTPLNIFEATLPGAAIATVLPFLKEGGYFQDFLPLYTHLCFLIAVAFSLDADPSEAKDSAFDRISLNYMVVLLMVALALHCVFSIKPLDEFRAPQLIRGVKTINPWTEFLPKSGNIDLGRNFVEEVKNTEGEVFMPSLGYYGWLAGKEPGYVGVALTDLLGLGITPEPLLADIRSHRYAAIFIPEYFETGDYEAWDLRRYGYTGPSQVIPEPRINYDLSPNIEIPPNRVYRSESTGKDSTE